MGESKHFRIKSSPSIHRGRRRETFKIAVSVRPQMHGTGGPLRRPEPALDDAEKIFESLVASGRLPRRPK